MEWGLHAQHDCHNFGMEGKSMPGDGVITGVGYVDGRPVAAFSQDFTVGGGALGRIHSKKICDIMDYAQKAGIPLIGINDSGGARIQEGDDSLSGYGQVFFRNVELSGLVPQISVIAGPCAGGAAYSPALTDFLIMTRKNANMFICGPEVIKAATGQTATMEEIGSASANASVSGNVHFIAEDDAQALQIARRLLSFLPPNNVVDPPHRPTPAVDMSPDPAINRPSSQTIPRRRSTFTTSSRGSSMAAIFSRCTATSRRTSWSGSAASRASWPGLSPTTPPQKAGTLDIDSSDKAARFIRFCNVFNIPIVTLVDVPGFLPGVAQERGGIIRHGAKMLFAYAASTVPKLTFILRKAYGGAYLAMCSRDMGADAVYAWPSAEIAVMGAEGAVKILFKREISAASRPQGQGKGACRRIPRKVRLALRGREQGHDHRRHRAGADAGGPLNGTAQHALQARNPAAEEARQHPVVIHRPVQCRRDRTTVPRRRRRIFHQNNILLRGSNSPFFPLS